MLCLWSCFCPARPLGWGAYIDEKPKKKNNSLSCISMCLLASLHILMHPRYFVKGNLSFFGSHQLMVAKMNERAGAKKTYGSDELLSSADAPYKRCVC